MKHVNPTEGQCLAIARLMKAQFPVTLKSLADELGKTELEAAALMPPEAVTFVSGTASERFGEVWAELATWEKVTLFIVHAGHVFEIQAKLSTGKVARGFYNIFGAETVGGHLRYGEVADIAFVNLPFMGRESLSVQFFGKDGSVAFSVYAGRENHKIIPSVRDAFTAARERLSK